MFAFRDTYDLGQGTRRIEVAFTDASLDLHEHHPGFPDALARVQEFAGVPFSRLEQEHGDDVVLVLSGEVPAAGEELQVADALVTGRSDVGLMIRTADCVPVLLADPVAGLIGAVHAGRKGIEVGVVGQAISMMNMLRGTDLRAWIGPHACSRCYEVPEEMRAEVAAVVPEAAAETPQGTPSIDLGAAVRAQLVAAGVSPEKISSVDRCTVEDEQLHSYRRDGDAAGRMGALVWFA